MKDGSRRGWIGESVREKGASRMDIKGLERATEILQRGPEHAGFQQEKGRKSIGFLSMHVPLELIEAVGLVPYRITGDIREPVTEADRGLPAAFCPYMRSVLDLSLKGRFRFLDGFAMAHACDAQEKTVRVLSSLVSWPFAHFIDVPATVHGYSVDYFRKQLQVFAEAISDFSGQKLTQDRLQECMCAYNKQRQLVRVLYTLNQQSPPALSGSEMLTVILALLRLPVDEGTRLLGETIEEVQHRGQRPPTGRPRVLLWGSVVDDPSYVKAIEDGGADVVIDDLDEGTRSYWADVDLDGDPFLSLGKRYLTSIRTARTFFDDGQDSLKKDNAQDLRARYGYLGEFIREWNVSGVILMCVRYCDPHGYELVDVKNYLRSKDVPCTYIEHNYSSGALAPMRTRIEAFVELLD